MSTTQEPRWRLAELKERAGRALSVDYDGPENGRVRAIPDERTLRYYTTIGLLDRAAEMRGRTAYYGWRHLLQIVAIKRLQEQGLALVDVQQRMSGRSTAALAAMARLPERPTEEALQPVEEAPASHVVRESAERREGAFWRASPAASPARAETGMQSLTLGCATLVWHGHPGSPEDEAAIRAASARLLRELTERRLVTA